MTHSISRQEGLAARLLRNHLFGGSTDAYTNVVRLFKILWR